SGYVFADDNNNHVPDPLEVRFQSIVVTLTGTDINGNAVSMTATTDSQGFYSFTGLVAGTYTLTKTMTPPGYTDGATYVDTVDGNPDGSAFGTTIGQIVLKAGQQGINYNFTELLAGS